MLLRGAGGKFLLLGSLVALSFPLYSTIAAAQHPQPAGAHGSSNRGSGYPRTASSGHGAPVRFVALRHGGFRGLNGGMKSKNRMLARRGGYGIQCVAFAKSETGIELSGNAVNWWENAAGVYQRGSRPQLGSVLNFQANGRMHLGHVAVVTNVVNSRQIDIDQANWPGPGIYSGSVARDIRVVDVSPRNDWTAVRVALGHTTDFGSVYPTFGFIYDRADSGTVITAGNMPSAPIPTLNPAPSDLRLSPVRGTLMASGQSMGYDEVAEAPASAPAVRHWHPRRRW